MNVADIADRAAAYDMPGVVVDGNDVTAVYEAAGEAVKRARAGEGPSLVECKTYRQRGHFEGDPQIYKPEDEVGAWLEKGPLPRYETKLLEAGLLTQDKIQELEGVDSCDPIVQECISRFRKGRSSDVDREQDTGFCRRLHADRARPGLVRAPGLPPAVRLRRGQPAAERLHGLLPAGEDPQSAGRVTA